MQYIELHRIRERSRPYQLKSEQIKQDFNVIEDIKENFLIFTLRYEYEPQPNRQRKMHRGSLQIRSEPC